ncbi:DUF6036 family nucleotidyltransferase [Gaiella sp.]|uniref:DUF6036 family nucleotidyltransferase n=1 Tax=Gaiella sp. TaxID=2663207 RepID=UPI0032653CD6
MRRLVDAERLRAFMRALGRRTDVETTCYVTGGATAVLLGWRDSTIDIDVLFAPENDQLLRALPELKEDLEINVELAFPGDFVPMPAGWEERSPFVKQVGSVGFRNVDFYAQALSKLERGHDRDLTDVAEMVSRGLVDLARLRVCFDEIERELYRFPAIDPGSFRAAVEAVADTSRA